jgi:hypothetical protein
MRDRLLRAISLGALAIGTLFIVLFLSVPSAPAATTCAEAPGGRGERWMWREIDGRKCWFAGDRLLPKADLRWDRTRPAKGSGPDEDPRRNEAPSRSAPRVLEVGARVVPEGMSNLSNWIDGRGSPIDLMRGEELQGAEMLGGVLVIPPYRDSAARLFDELER